MVLQGITASGNWIIDRTKIVDDYPPQDGLCNILSTYAANGGAPYNVLKALSKMGFQSPLKGIGVIGNDAEGELILNDCKEHKIQTTELFKTSLSNTSYTDVMTSQKTGRRTFFHYRGANALLDLEHFNVNNMDCKIFHLGYLLLLDKLDSYLGNSKVTRASQLLGLIQKKGIKTSVDLVSENSNRFIKIIPSSLPFVNYLFLNEYEAEKITGVQCLCDNGLSDISRLQKAAKVLLDMGVQDYVFLHYPSGAIAIDKNKTITIQKSLRIPSELIKGTSGAGDAFTAGVLYGLHEDYSVKKTLQIGVATAAASLFHQSCSESILPINRSLDLITKYKTI